METEVKLRGTLCLIAALADNRVIGLRDALPWNLRDDLKHFQELTKGRTVIAGRKTHESIVARLGKPLPGRNTIVLSGKHGYQAPGCTVVPTWYHALLAIQDIPNAVFVIGGANVYRLAHRNAERMYLTRVHASPDGDTFFPEWEDGGWTRMSAQRHEADERNQYPYTFEMWVRKA